MNYWWTSDYHFSHANIIKYWGRPFEKLEKVTEILSHNTGHLLKRDD